ncbi:MAG: choline dehydrogenase-like flavoprotein [Myxococcota bacterium]|jgi:choline dehydrogenase-like flavoprotein
MKYDAIIVGTGFASTFFLHRWLQAAPPSARVLVLERGVERTTDWRLANKFQLFEQARSSFDNRTDEKEWLFTLAFGGSSNCWWACTPRFLPEDFELKSRYGVGADWPLDYDALEPYYVEAERLLGVGGGRAPWKMSAPYPNPPHRMCTPGKLLAKADPAHWFPQPTARASGAQAGRKLCCNNGVCHLCPIDSKFSISNSMRAPYADPRVTVQLGSEVLQVETSAGVASGVVYRRNSREETAESDLVALGANAIFNAQLLLNSGLGEGGVGQHLHEQAGVYLVAELDGVSGFDGGTSISALGYPLYAGEHRRSRAGAHIEFRNSPPHLRPTDGRWRERLVLKLVFEDHAVPGSRVEAGERPIVTWGGHSPQTVAGLDAARELALEAIAALPVESVTVLKKDPTEAHILGTARMGTDPTSSVVDDGLRHHRLRNLFVLGTSAFPASGPANPTLTMCASVLRAVDKATGSAR